jgi:transcriptional regulator with XRE-family HTH domain
VSDDINSLRKQVWRALTERSYRDTAVDSHIGTNLAAQIYALREALGWTQAELADRAGMAQARISVMENPSYEQFTLSTLKRLRAAFDVALIVRFVPFTEFADWMANLTPEKLAPPHFEKEMEEKAKTEERSESPTLQASVLWKLQDSQVIRSVLDESPLAPPRPMGRGDFPQSNVVGFPKRAA